MIVSKFTTIESLIKSEKDGKLKEFTFITKGEKHWKSWHPFENIHSNDIPGNLPLTDTAAGKDPSLEKFNTILHFTLL